jgi:hypothetical protein
VAGATVSIGGVAAGTLTVVNATTITATVGAHAAGVTDVVVTNPDAQTATLSGGFTYLGAAATFTDDPLIAGTTPVRALHFTEARTYIGALRSRYGLSAMMWTDATIVAGTTTIKAAHLQEMQTALTAIYVAAGRTAPSFSVSAVAGVTGATAAQITEIRAAILAIW